MNVSAVTAKPTQPDSASTSRTLRRLFLTLFLRGRSARGLQDRRVPASIGLKLGLSLAGYAALGLVMALPLLHQPVFVLSVYLHAMSFMFVGMFVASSAGEILFNKEEADILLHRPIEPRELLWAKIAVLTRVSLWLTAAFNLAGLYTGTLAVDGDWRFPVAHVLSTALEALFCTGCIVVAYQLCLRWFGRERLEGLMTTAQVIVSVGIVLAGQILPRTVVRFRFGALGIDTHTWWVGLLPPAWFAGLDDALAGSGSAVAWILALLALIGTAGIVRVALGKLAHDYTLGWQRLGEAATPVATRTPLRRWMRSLVNAPPLSWWVRDPAERAAFTLSLAYLMRDRDVKLRIYPGVAPILVLPLILLFPTRGGTSPFSIALSGAYLGVLPMLALELLKYSQQWQAADLFRMAPVLGPAPFCHGGRKAVLLLVTLPVVLVVIAMVCMMHARPSQLLLLLPGFIALPVYSMLPVDDGRAVPLSQPSEEAKSMSRGLIMLAAVIVATVIAGLSTWAVHGGWFWSFLLGESVIAFGLYATMRYTLRKASWPPIK